MSKRIVLDLPIADRFNPPAEGKYIAYDRETGDYATFLDRQYLGHASTYQSAETKIANVYYDQLTHTTIETADTAAAVAAELEHEACLGAEYVTTSTHTTMDGATFAVTTLAPVADALLPFEPSVFDQVLAAQAAATFDEEAEWLVFLGTRIACERDGVEVWYNAQRSITSLHHGETAVFLEPDCEGSISFLGTSIELRDQDLATVRAAATTLLRLLDHAVARNLIPC